MKRQSLFAFLLLWAHPSGALAAPDSVDRATDTASHLEGRLTILRAKDGGARAIAVELRNTSRDADVVLKVNAEMSAFIMQTIADQEGKVLSTPARKFSSAEVQRHGTVRIARGASHRWQVPIAAQLPAATIPEEGLDGRLVVNVGLLFSVPGRGQQPADADFKTSILTLFEMHVRFTRAALAQPRSGRRPHRAHEPNRLLRHLISDERAL